VVVALRAKSETASVGAASNLLIERLLIVLAPACERGNAIMPITTWLDGYEPDPETKRVIGVAFEMTRAALRLVDRDDPAVAIIAKKIIELAKAGERNPDLLCERALKDLRESPPRA
jgi:hypothetical protein